MQQEEIARERVPGLLLGMVDGGASCLERRVLRLLDKHAPWARGWRVVCAGGCVAVMGVACAGAGMLAVHGALAESTRVSAPLHALLMEGQALTKAWEVAAGGKLDFDVASVRPSTSAEDAGANFLLGPGDVYAKTGGRFSAHNLTLVDYIRFAYKLTDSQVQLMEETAPAWVKTEGFDVEARASNHDPTKDQMRLMVQSLLAKRFGLREHTETRDVPVLAMVLNHPGKLGPQLRPHPADGPPCASAEPSRGRDAAPRADTIQGGFPVLCGGLVTAGAASVPSHVRVGARNVPLRLIASNLGGFELPLLDRTGLPGTYDFVLEWGRDPIGGAPGAAISPENPGTTIEEALREQLGIKLVREKGPVDVLVIDHIERPTEN